MVAQSLVEFFKTHLHDPDNSLIGLKANTQLFVEHYERTADGKKFRLPRDVKPVRENIHLPEIGSSS